MNISADKFGDTRCIIIWGSNPLNTSSCFRDMPQADIRRALKNGCKLIMMEPGKNRYCEKADYWLRLKPGSDGALAMGMIKVIIDAQGR